MMSFKNPQRSDKRFWQLCNKQRIFCLVCSVFFIAFVVLCIFFESYKSIAAARTSTTKNVITDIKVDELQTTQLPTTTNFDFTEMQNEHNLRKIGNYKNTKASEAFIEKEFNPVRDILLKNYRFKREVDKKLLNPLRLVERELLKTPNFSNNFIREKRRAEENIRSLKNQYQHCTQTAKDKRDCTDIYEKLMKITEDIGDKFSKMSKLLKEFNPKSSKKEQKLYFEMKDYKTSSEEKKLMNTSKIDEIFIDHPYFTQNSSKKVFFFDPVKFFEEIEKQATLLNSSKMETLNFEEKTQTKFDFLFHPSELSTTFSPNKTSTTPKYESQSSTLSTMVSTVATTVVTTIATTTENKPIDVDSSETITPEEVVTFTTASDVETTTTSTSTVLEEHILPEEPLSPTFIDENQLTEPNFEFIPRVPKIHEELLDDFLEHRQETDSLTVDKYMQWKAKQKFYPQNRPAISDVVSHTESNNQKSQQNHTLPSQSRQNITTKGEVHIGASGSLQSLCDQLSRKHNESQLKGSIPALPNQSVFFGTAGESTKASAQFLHSGFGNLPFPICFHVSPAPNYRAPTWGSQYGINSGPSLVNQGGYIYAQPPIGFPVHPSALGYIKQFPITGSGYVGSTPRASGKANVQSTTYCTYSPQPQQHFLYGNQSDSVVENISNADKSLREDSQKYRNIPDAADIVYATYSPTARAFNSSGPNVHCNHDQMSCLSVSECISKSKWCDSKIDCSDSSDEIICSCKSRLPDHKICDGYLDCPMGSDEMGCFGCDKFLFSCYNTATEFENARQTSLTLCYTKMEKCDGFQNCLSGKDEQECSSILARNDGTQGIVSHTEGVLHRNYQGVWYPVCNENIPWAREACEQEMGQLTQDPIFTFKELHIPGPYIHYNLNGLPPRFTEKCSHHASVVTCPPQKCGMTIDFESENSVQLRQPVEKTQENNTMLEIQRIVGGSTALPGALPFVVAIFRDGKFYCGGTIYTPLWIISAAHCVDHFTHHYYEVRAGILRRESYSPMVQIIPVTNVIAHKRYNRLDMKNDISMMKLAHPMLFNRWVKPICLPGPGRVTHDDKWVWGPKPGTLCNVIGWGALREKGSDSDSLQEVSVPINDVCKHAADRRSHQICAGEANGGRDACQGDSGGPLICESVSNPKEKYLAGVTSHGEGCGRPNEPGVYTRVALFLDWIQNNIVRELPSSSWTKSKCPGQHCVFGGGYCISENSKCDGFVDCLGGEDEVDCLFLPRSRLLPESNDSFLQEPLKEDLMLTKTISTSTMGSKIEKATIAAKGFNKTGFDQVLSKNLTTSIPTTTKSIVQPVITSTKKPESQMNQLNISETRPQQNASKSSKLFVCSKILQTINIEYRCDKIVDCEDGTDETNCTCIDYLKDQKQKQSDELEKLCKHNQTNLAGDCAFHEIKCKNGKCVDKTKFCDHINDCNDLSDEPSECSCFTYLQLSDPSKICDGVRNCYDKSDENPKLCTCSEDRFRCSSQSSFCVPYDYVCDDEIDCPGGEDERSCYDVLPSKDEYYEVVQQKYGVWQSMCFDKNSPAPLEDICHSIGYKNVTTAVSRPIIQNSVFNSTESMEVNGNQSRKFSKQLLQEATKAMVYNRFSPIKLNPDVTVYMKPSRPIAKQVSWDKSDYDKCHRFKIRCE